MNMKRRDFIGTALAAGVGRNRDGPWAPRRLRHQLRAGGPPPPKKSTAKVEKLWNIPSYKAMNALEAAPDGLWIGDQITEKVCRVDWNTGKILHEVQCESHNISGLAVGGGYIWAGSNGSVNNRRPPRPTDREYGEFSQLDMKTGKIVKVTRPVWGGGTHGLTYNLATNTLWTAALSIQCVAEMDPKDNLRVMRMFRTPGQRAHGLDLDSEFLWMLFATDREVHRVRHQHRTRAGDHQDSGIRAGCARTGAERWLSLLLRLRADGAWSRQRARASLQVQGRHGPRHELITSPRR